MTCNFQSESFVCNSKNLFMTSTPGSALTLKIWNDKGIGTVVYMDEIIDSIVNSDYRSGQGPTQ